MSVLIDRDAALEAVWEADSLELATHGANMVADRIRALPAVDPAAIREAALREAAALVASCAWSEYWVCDGEYMEPLLLSDRILALIDKKGTKA